jgi:hypothetical protein
MLRRLRQKPSRMARRTRTTWNVGKRTRGKVVTGRNPGAHVCWTRSTMHESRVMYRPETRRKNCAHVTR